MEISLVQEETVTIVTITGSVDGLTADRLMSALDGEIAGGRCRLVADASGLEYTSSAGLRALLATVKRSRSLGGDLRLAAVRAPVMRVLELAGFTGILKVYDDVPAAVASFGR